MKIAPFPQPQFPVERLLTLFTDSYTMREQKDEETHKSLLSALDHLKAEVITAAHEGADKVVSSRKAPDYSVILRAIDALSKQVKAHAAAVNAIEFPQPEKVDFTQVFQRIDRLTIELDALKERLDTAIKNEMASVREKIDAIDVTLPEIIIPQAEPPPKREVVFDVEYKAGGAIKRVIAKEV